MGPPDLVESWDELAPALVDPVISGDVAVDALAPARRPRQLVVHARTWGAQGVTGMVTVETLEEATVVLHLTDDQIVLGSSLRASWRGRNVPIADAMQLTYDLQSATGPDAPTANAAWLKHLLGREP